MVVAGLMQIVPLDTFRFAVSEYSLLQIVSPLGVALGAVFLAWLARQWESRDLDAATYPPAVGGLILASAAVVWLAIPSLWSTLTGSLLNTVGFSASAGARTIGEAQPPLQDASLADFVLGQYGLAFFLALAAVLYILARPSTVPTTRTTRSTSRPRSPWSAPSTRSPALRRHRRRRRRELAGDRTPHRGRLARRRDVPRRVRRRGAVLRRGRRSSGAPRSPKFASTTTSR